MASKEFFSNWDTSNVIDFTYMFAYSHNLTGHGLSSLDTSNVVTLKNLWLNSTKFSGNVSTWNTSNVETMQSLLAKSFNVTADITSWDTSSVTSLRGAFAGIANFDMNLSNWNTSSVTDMAGLCEDTSNFAADLSGWDTSNVIDLSRLWYRATNVSLYDLSGWDTSSVTTMRDLLREANVGATTTTEEWTSGLAHWDTSSVTDLRNVFDGTQTNSGDGVLLLCWNLCHVQAETLSAATCESDISFDCLCVPHDKVESINTECSAFPSCRRRESTTEVVVESTIVDLSTCKQQDTMCDPLIDPCCGLVSKSSLVAIRKQQQFDCNGQQRQPTKSDSSSVSSFCKVNSIHIFWIEAIVTVAVAFLV